MKILIAFLAGLVVCVPFGVLLIALVSANDNGKGGNE